MSGEVRRDVFQAIADPTRRRVISLLAAQAMNLNALADHFDISRPAVSQQVKILAECGLVTVRKEGRERICEARLDGLAEVSGWIEQYRALWNERFASLENFLAKTQNKPSRKTSKK